MKCVHIEAGGLMKTREREAMSALTACATTEERSPACVRHSLSLETLPMQPLLLRSERIHRSCTARSLSVYDSCAWPCALHCSSASTALGVA